MQCSEEAADHRCFESSVQVSGWASLARFGCHDDGCRIRLHADVINVLGGARNEEPPLAIRVTSTGLVSRGPAGVSMIVWTYQLQLVLPPFVFQAVNDDWRWSPVQAKPFTTSPYLFSSVDPGYAIYCDAINICKGNSYGWNGSKSPDGMSWYLGTSD